MFRMTIYQWCSASGAERNGSMGRSELKFPRLAKLLHWRKRWDGTAYINHSQILKPHGQINHHVVTGGPRGMEGAQKQASWR